MNIRILTLSIFLCSCSLIKTEPPILDKPKLNLGDKTELNLSEVKFQVVTTDNSKQYFEKNDVAFALTEQQYKNLSLNIEEIKSFMRKQSKMLNIYKEYYEGESNAKEN